MEGRLMDRNSKGEKHKAYRLLSIAATVKWRLIYHLGNAGEISNLYTGELLAAFLNWLLKGNDK